MYAITTVEYTSVYGYSLIRMYILYIIQYSRDQANYWSIGQFNGQCMTLYGHRSNGQFNFYYIIYNEII